MKSFVNSVSPEVNTKNGRIQGLTVRGKTSDLFAFYGIPYAEPPIGNLRWRPAEPKTAWDGILACNRPLTEQNSAYQWGNDLLEYFRTLNMSEDCLYLNITTPSVNAEAKLPVIVWFHGGGLFGGSGSEEVYNLPYLPEKGCVLVTVTTRLGALGLLAADLFDADETSGTANFIISDMLEALHWVNANISAFGGDSGNVTIAGESGGAHKVSVLLAVREAKGLFQKAILQSGVAAIISLKEAKNIGNRLMKVLGVHSVVEARSVPAGKLVEAFNTLNVMSEFIADGYYLTEAPADSVLAGRYNACPIIVGANSGELTNLFPMIGGIGNYIKLLNRAAGDGYPAYAYELDQVPATWRALDLKCVHSMDIAYLFGAYDNAQRFYSGGPWDQQFAFHDAGERLDFNDFISPVMDEYDRQLSETVMALWYSFAKSGVPESGSVKWIPWTQECKEYLILTQSSESGPYTGCGFDRLEVKFP